MIRLKLKDLYEQRQKTQQDVHRETGIRQATLSALSNNFRKSLDIELLERLMVYFGLTDLRDLVEYQPPESRTEFLRKYNKEGISKKEDIHVKGITREQAERKLREWDEKLRIENEQNE